MTEMTRSASVTVLNLTRVFWESSGTVVDCDHIMIKLNYWEEKVFLGTSNHVGERICQLNTFLIKMLVITNTSGNNSICVTARAPVLYAFVGARPFTI